MINLYLLLLEKTLTFHESIPCYTKYIRTLFFLRTIGIKCTLEKLDPSKSAGPDNTPSHIVKLCAAEVAQGKFKPIIYVRKVTAVFLHVTNHYMH